MSNDQFYFDALLSNCAGTSRWRDKLAQKYPADKRNITAAAELERLSRCKFCEVDVKAWAALQPYLQSPAFPEALNDATKAVAFRSFPRDISDLIANVAANAKAFAPPLSMGGAQ